MNTNEHWLDEAAATAALRRIPTQQRSRAKVIRTLDAADALLGEIGYERTVESPALILSRAEITAGTFYTYFENVEAVIEALSLRYVARVKAIVDGLVARSYACWEDASDAIVDAYAADFMRHPAVRELWINSHLSQRALAADQEGNVYVAARIAEIMKPFESKDVQPGTPLQYRMLVELEDNLLRLAFRIDECGDPEAISEVKAAHRAYLATFVGAPLRPDLSQERLSSSANGHRSPRESAAQHRRGA